MTTRFTLETMEEKDYELLHRLLREGKSKEFNDIRPSGEVCLDLDQAWTEELHGFDFSEVNFDGNRLEDLTFSECNFTQATFCSTVLTSTRFYTCNFDGADFENAVMKEVVCRPADFTRAKNIGQILENDSLVAAVVALQNQQMLRETFAVMWEQTGDQRVWQRIQQFSP